MKILESVRHKLDRFGREFRRTDIDRAARFLNVAELALKTARISDTLKISNERIYELSEAPRMFHGLRDLKVRLADHADLDALASVAGTPTRLIIERLARGDLAYVGEHEDRLLAHAWFHRGPEPFPEDAPTFPRWAIPADTCWSYHAYTLPEARRTGVFVKVFQHALHQLLNERGAARVRCMINATNTASIRLHERTGFRRLGTVTALSIPGSSLVSWRGEGGARYWLQRHRDATAVLLPPPT